MKDYLYLSAARRGGRPALFRLPALLIILLIGQLAPAALGQSFKRQRIVKKQASAKTVAAKFSSGLPAACTPAPIGLLNFYAAEGSFNDARTRNHATAFNGVGFGAGRVGQAFSFDGVDDNARIQRQVAGDMTIAFWLQTTQAGADENGNWSGGYGLVDSEVVGPTNDFGIALGNGKVLFGTGGPDTTIKSPQSVNDGGWHFVVATRDSATGALMLYVDGAAVANGTGAAGNLNASATITFGSINTNLNRFQGQLDEIGLYDRVLSAGEVQTLYGNGGGTVCQPLATAAPSGLLSWHAGEGDARDLSGDGNTGTLSNGAGFAVGKVGQSFAFDGVDDRVEIPNVINGRTQMSVEGWFKYTDVDAWRWIYGTGPAFVEVGAAVSPINSALRYHFRTDEDVITTGEGSITLTPDTWYHFAMTYDGSQIKGYVNGQADYSAFISGPIDAPSTLAIGGGFWNIAGEVFKGSIDELSFYDRPLSVDEIQSIVDAGLGGKAKIRSFAETDQATIGTAIFNFSPTNFVTSFAQETPLDPAQLPPLPAGWEARLAFDESMVSEFLGTTSICFNVPALAAEFNDLHVLHLENGVWVNRTATGNASPELCTTALGSFSPFMIAKSLAPTVAQVPVGGRVVTAAGRGIGGATVTLALANGATRTALTNNFGYYRFEAVAVGQTIAVSAAAKRYRFAQPTQIVSVTEEESGINFTALN